MMLARAKKLAGLAALLGVVFLLAASDAKAHGPGYYGGYGSYYGSYRPGYSYAGYYAVAPSCWRPTIVIVLPGHLRIGHYGWHDYHHHSYWWRHPDRWHRR